MAREGWKKSTWGWGRGGADQRENKTKLEIRRLRFNLQASLRLRNQPPLSAPLPYLTLSLGGWGLHFPALQNFFNALLSNAHLYWANRVLRFLLGVGDMGAFEFGPIKKWMWVGLKKSLTMIIQYSICSWYSTIIAKDINKTEVESVQLGKLRYCWYGQMSPGQMLPGQMSWGQLQSVVYVPRTLSLKFDPNWVSNSWDIADMDKCCLVKCHGYWLYLGWSCICE